jgi:GT2 family glycosyltransferase
MDSLRTATIGPKLRDRLDGGFRRTGPRRFAGHVRDLSDPMRIFTVDILVDGCIVKSLPANEFQGEPEPRGKGCGDHGFSVWLDADILRHAAVVEARLSNLNRLIGAPLQLDAASAEDPPAHRAAEVNWLGGLRFAGAIRHDGVAAASLDVRVDGERVLETRALGWRHLDDEGARGRAARAFDFHLPERFADGRVHHLTILGDNGDPLGGAAFPFVAFEDGLKAAIARLGRIDSERLRGEMFDQLLPMALPMAQYESWRVRFPLPPPPRSRAKAAVVLVGSGEIGPSLPSLEEQTHDDWVAAALDGRPAGFLPTELLSFLETEAGDSAFVVFGLAGTRFEADALARIAAAFEQAEPVQIVYGDIDLVARDGALWPLCFPAFDYERMLEQGYCAQLFAMRHALARRLVAGGAADLYRLFNSAFDAGPLPPGEVLHLPGALAQIPPLDIPAATASLELATADHLRWRGVSAEVAAGPGTVLPAVRVRRVPATGRTTIIIPVRNRLALLKRCLDSIVPALQTVPADILIVDNGSSEPDMIAYLADIAGEQIQTLRLPGAFNFARLNNIAAEASSSDYLCLLNNDVEAIDANWLAEMLGRLQEPDVGAVGALLLWPSGVVQHGGVVLGPSFAAQHAFNDRIDGDPGYADLLRVAHQTSAVTAACLLTRRSDYLRVGGLDETHFAIAFNDVDYCLKLRAAGRRIVFTPHARLWHLESASRGRDDAPDKKSRLMRELRALRAKWTQSIIDDPCYSPVLSLDPVPYSALAWPPRDRGPRAATAPTPRDVPAGF